MRQVAADRLATLLADCQPPCISLYQPTHRHHPENQQDPIRYRNLLKQMEASLREKYAVREVRSLLEEFQALVHDDLFWDHRTDGLAILAAPGKFQIFELQRPVVELLVVADSFHTKPLLRVLQSADRYQILCLSRREAKLFEDNRDALDPVELTNVPSTITEALGEERAEPHQSVRSYATGPAGRGEALYHGHGSKKDEVEADTERFFRAVDRAILEHHSRPSGLPLMLAALPEYHAPFRALTRNPLLMEQGMRLNPDALSQDALRAEAWRIVEPRYWERLADLVESYRAARARQLASNDLAEAAHATVAGRVGVLLVEADRELPGRIDPATGQIEPGDLSHPEIDDALDDLADMVLARKGEVVVVPAERMPSDTGLAATYRF
jgi:hypothetical protein